MKAITWIPEPDAAKMLQYHPERFRRKVKNRELDIAYTNFKGRKFQYCLADIERVLIENSTITR